MRLWLQTIFSNLNIDMDEVLSVTVSGGDLRRVIWLLLVASEGPCNVASRRRLAGTIVLHSLDAIKE